METKQYIGINGDVMKVEMVDEERKQVYASVNGMNRQWFLERDYSLWKEMPTVYIPDIPAQIIEVNEESANQVLNTEEKPKRKRTKKEL